MVVFEHMDATEEIVFVISLHPDGQRFALMSDALPTEELGKLSVMRASNVEFNDGTQKWEGVMTGESDPRFIASSRRDCIRQEVAFIAENFTQVTETLFPQP